jgi:hypothetical protein
MSLITMYDSIEPSALPADAQAVAGYVGGHWPDYSPIVARFPNARHKSVAVNAEEDADILDIERGDAVPEQYPAWHKRQVARGVELPGPYAPASLMPSVLAACKAAGIEQAELADWWAHWNGEATLEGGGRAKQYIDHGPHGENYDVSVCDPSFWGTKPSPPAHNSPHYDWFPNSVFAIFGEGFVERTVVKRYDKLRATQTATSHPHQAQLHMLRWALGLLAGRVYTVAHNQPRDDGSPSWNVDHRGWRYQQLIHRAQGARLA